jgi:hypothetical protein
VRINVPHGKRFVSLWGSHLLSKVLPAQAITNDALLCDRNNNNFQFLYQ